MYAGKSAAIADIVLAHEGMTIASTPHLANCAPAHGAKVASHGRYVTFQLAEVAVPRELFRKILRLIDGLRPAPLPP